MTNLSSMISQSGYGIGEINAIDTPSNATGWGISGLGMTVGTTSTSTDLPLEGMVTTAVKLTPDAGGTGYAYRRFTIAEALKGYNLKLEWWQRCSANYTSGDLHVDLYYYADSGYTSGTRITPLNGASSTDIVKINGKFTLTFAAPTSTVYLEIRVTRVSGVSPIALSVVTVGPGIQPQGAVVEEWKSYTPTITGTGSKGTTSLTGKYRRVGETAEIRVYYSGNTAAAGSGSTVVQVSIPTGLTINYSSLLAGAGGGQTLLGSFVEYNIKNASQYSNSQQVAGYSSTTLSFLEVGAGTFYSQDDLNIARTVEFSLYVTVPISEWSGSGTVQLAQNDVEYASNSSTSDADDSSSFVYGPAGSTTPGPLTGTRRKRVRFQTPIQPTDLLVVEFRRSTTSTWYPVMAGDSSLGLIPFTAQNGVTYGLGIYSTYISSTDIDIIFGRYLTASGATYGAAGDAWATTNGYWRVRKTSAGAAVGFGLASADSAGLIPSYVAPTTPTFSASNFTSNVGSWTVDAGDCACYMYSIVGKVMNLWVGINSSTVSGTPGHLRVAIPAGKTTAPSSGHSTTGVIVDNGGSLTAALIAVDPGLTYIKVYANVNAGAWVGGTDNCRVQFSIAFPIA